MALCAAGIVRFTLFGGSGVDEQLAPTDPFFYIFTFYLFPFAGLLLVAELRWQRVFKYFSFLGYFYGKGMFIMFIALLLFDIEYPVDAAISGFASLVGLFNILMTCMSPSGSLLQLSLNKEDEDILGESQTQEEEDEGDSDYDADEHDGLLPRTYGTNEVVNRRAGALGAKADGSKGESSKKR